MTDKTTDPNASAGLRIQHELEVAISVAVDKARSEAAAHPYLGHPMRRRRDDYYADVALHHLFLIACGADVETRRGGDVRTASRLLHVGGTIARGWQKADMGAQEIMLPKMPDTSEDDLINREELPHSARWLVEATVMKALVEHICEGNPEFRNRVSAAIKARVPEDDSGSLQSELFNGFVTSATRAVLGELND